MLNNYNTGRAAAQRLFGVKLADDDDKNDDSHTARNVGMAAAMAAPWAGKIGEKPMIHADQGPAMSMEQLQKTYQPGDVIISGDTSLSGAKGFISTATGTPKGYHISVVGPDGKSMYESHPSMGYDRSPYLPGETERVQLLRPQMSKDEIRGWLSNLEAAKQRANTWENASSKELTKLYGGDKAMGREFGEIARGGLYDDAQGLRAGLKELFVPKTTLAEGAADAQKAQITDARAMFDKTMPQQAKRVSKHIGSMNDKQISTMEGRLGPLLKTVQDHSPEFVKEHLLPSSVRGYTAGKDVSKVMPNCVGGVCSTMPAGVLPKGRNVVPNKLPNDVLPHDYLRSELFKPVARFDPSPKLRGHDRLLEHGPTLARLGVGALGAGLVYGGSKLWSRFKNRNSADTPG